MKILAVETSTQAGSVAVVDDEELVSERFVKTPRTHSERLLSAIDDVLEMSGVTLAELDGFAVSLGPGSFTGLRIGLSTVKGLAMATEKPLAGIPTLDVLAQNVPFTSRLVCPMLDARKSQIFAALFRWQEDGGLAKLTENMAVKPEDLLGRISEEVVVLGSGVRTYQEVILEKLGARTFIAPPHLQHPRAAVVGCLGLDLMKRKGFHGDPLHVVPVYVRPSEAELKWSGST
jgi:tRNA threonylcarbamoyladenosine biosynthesis protein TsaB